MEQHNIVRGEVINRERPPHWFKGVMTWLLQPNKPTGYVTGNPVTRLVKRLWHEN